MINRHSLYARGDILYYGIYKRYWLDKANDIKNPNINDFTYSVMDVKAGKIKALRHFFDLLHRDVDQGVTICYVPSSNPANINTGIKRIAYELCRYGRIDATSCLQRHTEIQSAKMGGDRSKAVHYNSVRVVNRNLVQNRDVLLLDDVTTTNNSLLACKELLLRHGGARVVQCVALGQTEEI